MVRLVDDLDGIASADRAGRDNAQVCPRHGGLGELLDPARLLKPALECRTRNPRARHLEYHLGADLPPFPYAGTADIQACCRQVLTESAVRQRPPQDGFPEIKIGPSVGLHRLIGSAMMLHVTYPVASQAYSAVAHSSRRAHQHRAVYWPFLDAGRSQALPGIGLWPADVDRKHSHIRRQYGSELRRRESFTWTARGDMGGDRR